MQPTCEDKPRNIDRARSDSRDMRNGNKHNREEQKEEKEEQRTKRRRTRRRRTRKEKTRMGELSGARVSQELLRRRDTGWNPRAQSRRRRNSRRDVESQRKDHQHDRHEEESKIDCPFD